jgi:hypothetical protein
MSAKNSFEKLLAENQSLGSSFNSDSVAIDAKTNILGINLSTSSITDNTGDFVIQHRIWKDFNSFSGWADLTLSSTIVLNNANITTLIYLIDLPKGQVRVSFTAAGSTPDGTVDIWVSGKES